MLAYVFWHWAAIPMGYESALISFHRALAADPPPGFQSSRVFRVGNRPWFDVESAYEDWYFVDDFTALGALNDAAVHGSRKASHDAVASRPAGGVAALYGHVSGDVIRPRHATFRSKPAGISYFSFGKTIPADAEVWQRKMVLGPAPEFCILTVDALEDSRGLDRLYPSSTEG